MQDVPEPLLPLFDLASGESPPAGTIELYLETPASLGLLRQHAPAELPDIAAAVDAAREAGVAAAVECLRRDGGYVRVGHHQPRRSGGTIGEFARGRLRLTRVAHDWVAGHDDALRLHDHLYLGPTGEVTGRFGELRDWPVDTYSLQRQVITMMRAEHRRAVRLALADALDVVWTMPPPPAVFPELERPNLLATLADYPRQLCRDRFAGTTRWLVHELPRAGAGDAMLA